MMPVLIGTAATCGFIGVVSFVLYAIARMKENEANERLYLRVHYISLVLLFITGVFIMFYMGAYSD